MNATPTDTDRLLLLLRVVECYGAALVTEHLEPPTVKPAKARRGTR